MSAGKPLSLAERQAFRDFAYTVIKQESARCTYLMGVPGGGTNGFVNWLEYRMRQRPPRRPVVVGMVPAGWIRVALLVCVLLCCNACTLRVVMEQPGQAAAVEAWQGQITQRVNDITTCLPPETRACIDMQHPPKP